MEAIILNAIYIALLFGIGFKIAHKNTIRYRNPVFYSIFLVHVLFIVLYYVYALNNTADANSYYNRALNQEDIFLLFKNGTQSISFIAAFFIKYLLFNKFSLFFLFGLFGFIGFIYLAKMLEINKLKIFGIPIIFIILLLPGFHFWTAALGKDSIVFMAIILFFYSLKDNKKHYVLLLLSFALLTFIRGYLGLIILTSIIFAFIFRKPSKMKLGQFFFLFITIISIIILFPFFKDFLNLETFSIENLINRSKYYNEQGTKAVDNLSSYIDVSNYSTPNKMFAYFFRPLFFDAHSILQFIISFENLLLIIIILKWLQSIRFNIIKWYTFLDLIEKIMFFYVLIGWVIMASSMYNLGLASRQKYMFLPVLFILIFKNLNKNKNYVRH